MKNEVVKELDLFIGRKSIRKFSSKPVEEVDVLKIIKAGQRAPTACNLQTYSVVWVKDKKLKDKVLDACEVSGTIREAPIVFAICADIRRLSKVLNFLKHDHCFKHGHGNWLKLMSIMDACFFAENMVMAAEFLGLGSVYIGSALANNEVIKELKLSSGVLPLTLLCVGYPDEQPDIKPRWALNSVLHVDAYEDPNEEEIEVFLSHMNQELEKQGYYQQYDKPGFKYRYSNHVKGKTDLKQNEKDDKKILPLLKKMGFVFG